MKSRAAPWQDYRYCGLHQVPGDGDPWLPMAMMMLSVYQYLPINKGSNERKQYMQHSDCVWIVVFEVWNMFLGGKERECQDPSERRPFFVSLPIYFFAASDVVRQDLNIPINMVNR